MTPLELRALFQDESTLHRMTSSNPPVTMDVHEVKIKGRTVYEVVPDAEPGDRIGQSLSGELVSLIGAIRADFVSYGPRHPVRRAMTDYERLCRRRHRLPTWKDHAAGPVCSRMLRLMVEHGASLLWASQECGVSYTRAERHVAAAATFVSRWIFHWDHEQQGIGLDPDCPICNTRQPAIDLRRPAMVGAPTTR